jgi:hypothetical protein
VNVKELHAAVFAVGDCFGDPAAAREAERIRLRLDPTLTAMVQAATKPEYQEHLIPIARALAYLIATTAHVRTAESEKLLHMLDKVDDEPTQIMREWGLRRVSEENRGKPPHHVAILGMTNAQPRPVKRA